MEQTVPHVLSSDDSAKAEAFARQILAVGHPADKMRIARYGMNLFQQIKPSMDDELEYLATLYMQPIDELTLFLEPMVASAADAYLTAFENAVALNVHLLCTHQPLPIAAEPAQP